MKKYLLITLLILATGVLARAQSSDPLVSNCVMSAGSNTRYLKDFRVQLGKGSSPGKCVIKHKYLFGKIQNTGSQCAIQMIQKGSLS